MTLAAARVPMSPTSVGKAVSPSSDGWSAPIVIASHGGTSVHESHAHTIRVAMVVAAVRDRPNSVDSAVLRLCSQAKHEHPAHNFSERSQSARLSNALPGAAASVRCWPCRPNLPRNRGVVVSGDDDFATNPCSTQHLHYIRGNWAVTRSSIVNPREQGMTSSPSSPKARHHAT